MITTISELSRNDVSSPGRERDHRAAEHAAEAGQQRAEEERAGEHELHVDAERRDHVAVVDAGAHDLAEARALDQPATAPSADQQRGAEHDDAAEEAEPHVAGQRDARRASRSAS